VPLILAKRPAVGITMGDAAGIGPEIVLRSLDSKSLTNDYRCIVVGDLSHLHKVAALLDLRSPLLPFNSEVEPPFGTVEVFDLKNLPTAIDIGIDSGITGRASAENVVAAVQLWRDGLIDAVATAPISKKAISLGGYNYPGHTEFIAELTGAKEFAMSFFAENLRVVLLTTHLSLVDAIRSITEDRLVNLIDFTNREFSRLMNKEISIAVAGLNPHASESGMFGSEETEIIAPAVERSRKAGINVSGPYSPDTVFLRGFQGEFDTCIALYHDQATIPVKAMSFGSAVNVTLGLPLIRTSVDHGTAYDIVGSGKADHSSMAAAIQLAGQLVRGLRDSI
jgi:4-hydroxythreonine-4-phosphate dehydrogenase